jgi:hypothetical protein
MSGKSSLGAILSIPLFLDSIEGGFLKYSEAPLSVSGCLNDGVSMPVRGRGCVAGRSACAEAGCPAATNKQPFYIRLSEVSLFICMCPIAM